MIELFEKLSKCFLIALFLFLFAFPLSSALADDGNGNGGGDDVEEIPLAPSDPDISDICVPADCSPAKACADPDQSCYTINGAFYCCIEPPSPGMESVGD